MAQTLISEETLGVALSHCRINSIVCLKYVMNKLGVWLVWLVKDGDSPSRGGWMKMLRISLGK
jgi:hypothetical protein